MRQELDKNQNKRKPKLNELKKCAQQIDEYIIKSRLIFKKIINYLLL